MAYNLLFQKLVQSKHQYSKMVMSPRVTTKVFQEQIRSRVMFTEEQRVKGAMLPGKSGANKVKTHHLFFIDDLSTAAATGKTGRQKH